MKKIFISYSWEDESYNSQVKDFVNKLIDRGYDVCIDKREIESNYSIDMQEMMHKGLTEADKVIVLLSESYKKKAESFTGGVGQEFKLILADIVNQRRKYILSSLSTFTSPRGIAPLAFQSRFIYNLSNEKGLTLLYDMLEDRISYGFHDDIEEIHVSQVYRNEVYQKFLCSPMQSYFHFKGKAGEVYAELTRMNIKVGDWNEYGGIDNEAIYFIAEAIKRHYDNIWTKDKTIEELADDITKQIIAYLRYQG